MLGLIMMSMPLGIAVGLSAVALVWAEPDGSAADVEEGIVGTNAAGSSMMIMPPHNGLALRPGSWPTDLLAGSSEPLLPSPASLLGNALKMPIALGRSGLRDVSQHRR
jgi:hypothetical protein